MVSKMFDQTDSTTSDAKGRQEHSKENLWLFPDTDTNTWTIDLSEVSPNGNSRDTVHVVT